MTTTVTIVITSNPDGTATITVSTFTDDGRPPQAASLNLTAGSPEPK